VDRAGKGAAVANATMLENVIEKKTMINLVRTEINKFDAKTSS